MEKRFQGRTALVTGAASGMGLVASRMFAQEGAKVYIVDIDEERANAAAKEICAEGNHAVACICDVRDYAQIVAVVEQCIQEENAIDIIVNFAGGFPARM